VPVSSFTTTVRAPEQMVPLPTALQGSKDGGGGFSVCVTGCPALAAAPGINVANVMPANNAIRFKRNMGSS
jgi:hypothetical protein